MEIYCSDRFKQPCNVFHTNYLSLRGRTMRETVHEQDGGNEKGLIINIFLMVIRKNHSSNPVIFTWVILSSQHSIRSLRWVDDWARIHTNKPAILGNLGKGAKNCCHGLNQCLVKFLKIENNNNFNHENINFSVTFRRTYTRALGGLMN